VSRLTGCATAGPAGEVQNLIGFRAVEGSGGGDTGFHRLLAAFIDVGASEA